MIEKNEPMAIPEIERYAGNPIVRPEISNSYEAEGAFNPTATVDDGRVYLFYRAEAIVDGLLVSSIAAATSLDGFNFTKLENNPVISRSMPQEKRGCEDPRITKVDGRFYLTYTAYDGMFPEKSLNIYTALAVSDDLLSWQKLGIILTDIKAGAICPVRFGDEYVMYIGGMKVFLARSKDLINWELDEEVLLDIRPGMFDSRFVEAGPAPIVFNDFIALIVNTADDHGAFHPSLVIIDRNDPRKILYRADHPLMVPDEEYEKNGRIKNVIFVTGIVEKDGKYIIYYGASDTSIAAATVDKTQFDEYCRSLIGKAS